MNAPEPETRATLRLKALALMHGAFSYVTLSNLLRLIGAGVLVMSVSVFLLRGWDSGNDVQRYAMLLAHTILLGVTGLGIGHWVRESKGARLFLALSLVSTLVNFAVLGGLVYSEIQWDRALHHYPGFAHWQAGSMAVALGTTGMALTLLTPVVWIAFRTLARRSASRLAVLFLGSGTLLLIPLRQTEAVALIILVAAVFLIDQLARLRRRDATLATVEGRFAQWAVAVPLFLLAGRGVYLYSADAIMYTALWASAFVALRQSSTDSELSSRTSVVLNRISTLPAIATAAGVTSIAADANLLADALYIPVFAAVAASLFVDISLRSVAGGSGYRRLAGLTVATAAIANLWLFPGLFTAAVSLVCGLIIAVYGYSVQQRIVFSAGLVTFIAGVVYQCRTVFVWFEWENWIVLALIGIVAIVTGSVLERHGTVMRARLTNWRQSMEGWQN